MAVMGMMVFFVRRNEVMTPHLSRIVLRFFKRMVARLIIVRLAVVSTCQSRVGILFMKVQNWVRGLQQLC